jgi:hypothetical protein
MFSPRGKKIHSPPVCFSLFFSLSLSPEEYCPELNVLNFLSEQQELRHIIAALEISYFKDLMPWDRLPHR